MDGIWLHVFRALLQPAGKSANGRAVPFLLFLTVNGIFFFFQTLVVCNFCVSQKGATIDEVKPMQLSALSVPFCVIVENVC
jgi:hypothetical protein